MMSLRSRLLVLPFAVLLLACNDDGKGEGDASASVGDGDRDGDGNPTDDGDPTGDGDGDPGCTLGELNCACSDLVLVDLQGQLARADREVLHWQPDILVDRVNVGRAA